MFIGRQNEITTISKHLHRKPNDPEARKIFSIYGLFGAGKSTLLREIETHIIKEGLCDAILISNEDVNIQYLPEFVHQLALSFRSCREDVHRFYIDEIESRRLRFLEIIGALQSNDFALWQQISDQSQLNLSKQQQISPEHLKELLAQNTATYEAAVKNQFNNADDQRLTLDTGNVVSEALIVDLMNTFFPLNSKVKSLEEYIRNSPPRKIIIVIDTFEKISHAINNWLLESFLPYCYRKRFGDFRSYDSPYLQPEFAVSQFLDFRFIIAGREPVTLTDYERRWDRYRNNLQEIHLSGFTLEEIGQYLKAEGVGGDHDLEKIYSDTAGLPYLVSLWVDAVKAHHGGTERNFLSTLAQQRIFWYKSDEQREWIRCAAFCEWFDADTLRCFPTIGDKYRSAFSYLRSSSELTRPSPVRQGKLTLHPIIQACLREATFQESEELARQYETNVRSFYDVYELLGEMDFSEREIARNLAYFPRFDSDFALKNFFHAESSQAREFVDNHTDLFRKSTFTYSFLPEAEKILTRYNQLIDKNSFEEKNAQVRSLWAEREMELQADISEAENEISGLRDEVIRLEGEIALKKQLADHAQGRYMTTENEATLLRRRWSYRLADRDIAAARIAFILAAIFAILGYFIPDIVPYFEKVEPEAMSATLAKVLYSVAIFFGIAFVIFFFRMMYVRAQKIEMRNEQGKLEQVEAKLVKEQTEIQTLRQDSESASKRLAKIKEKIINLNERINQNRLRLAEPYI